MKTLVYETKVDSRAVLRHSIFAAAEHICNHPDIMASTTQSLLMRAENCIGAGGGHFEQLLQSRYCVLVQASTGCGRKNSPVWEANKFEIKEDTANVFFFNFWKVHRMPFYINVF